MSLVTTKKISLDFYNNNIVTINAKQFDTDSRYINVTCTDCGKKATLNPNEMVAYVRYKKSDGKNVLNDALILEDGTIQIELTQQMLASTGKQVVDLLILAKNGMNVDSLEDVNDFYDLGVTIISTMTFYINVLPPSVDHPEITSSDEFEALTLALGKMSTVEQHMKDLDDTLSSNELERQSNEEERQTNEQQRITAEAERDTAEAERQSAEIQRQANEEQRQTAEEQRQIAEGQRESATATALEECETATQGANDAASDARISIANVDEYTEKASQATDRANLAASKCEDLIIESGVIPRSEKGTAGGVATLDDNTKIPNVQINTTFTEATEVKEVITSGESFDSILGKTAAYMTAVDEMTQASSELDTEFPILLANSDSPVDGDFTGTYYNTGITVNPNKKSITIGDAVILYEDVDGEKRLTFSFN